MNLQTTHRYLGISTLLLVIASCSQTRTQPEVSFSFSPTVQYSIFRGEANDIFRSIDVRLNKGLDSSTLKAVAQEIVNREEAQYVQTLILYYLPDTKPGNGAWASSSSDSYGSVLLSFDIDSRREEHIRGLGLDSIVGPPKAELVYALADLKEMLAELKLRFADDDPRVIDIQRKINEHKIMLTQYEEGQ